MTRHLVTDLEIIQELDRTPQFQVLLDILFTYQQSNRSAITEDGLYQKARKRDSKTHRVWIKPFLLRVGDVSFARFQKSTNQVHLERGVGGLKSLVAHARRQSPETPDERDEHLGGPDPTLEERVADLERRVTGMEVQGIEAASSACMDPLAEQEPLAPRAVCEPDLLVSAFQSRNGLPDPEPDSTQTTSAVGNRGEA